MWGDGEATCLTMECEKALGAGVTRAQLAEMMAHAFRISRAVPPAALPGLEAQCRDWAADAARPLGDMPKADMHAHMNGSLPPRWFDAHSPGAAIAPLRPADKAAFQWRDLDHFREDYDTRGKAIKAAGLESLPSQVEAVAEDCARHNVKVIELSVTPWGDHDAFFAFCAEGRRLARENHGVFVSFVVTAIR